MSLKSIFYKNILKILLTQKFAELAPANQGQKNGANSAIFWVSRILSMFLFKMDFSVVRKFSAALVVLRRAALVESKQTDDQGVGFF